MTEIDDALRQAGLDYEALFVPSLFEPWSRAVLSAADVSPGQRILDVACGTGIVTRQLPDLVGEGGAVVGLDAAPGMIAAARDIEPRVEWVLGSAESLPFEDARFDCVVSQFGLMFFEPPALGEMWRVLRPGGQLVVAVWNALDDNPVYATLVELLRTELGDDAANALALPFSLGDASPIATRLEDLGFSSVAVQTSRQPARFPSVEALVGAELQGWLPLFDIHPTEEETDALVQAAAERLAAHVTPDGAFAFETSAHLITAVR